MNDNRSIEELTPEDISRFKYTLKICFDVERSFSKYKAILWIIVEFFNLKI